MTVPLPCELIHIISRIQDTSLDLSSCGQASYHLFASLFTLFPADPSRVPPLAASLVRLSDERILSYNYKDVPPHWRRLYTDASILKIIALLSLDERGTDWETSVKELDLVLIVAGAPGQRREEIVFELIEKVQSRLDGQEETIDRPRKRFKTEDEGDSDSARRSAISPTPTPSVLRPIPRLREFPFLDEYITRYSQEPFIVSSGCVDWPASDLWSDKTYLLRVAGPGRVVPVEVGANYTAQDWGQRILPFSTVLDSIFGGEDDVILGPKLYLAQHDLFRQIPRLKTDILVPDLVYSAPEATKDYPDYRAPMNEDGYVLNAWLGPGGTTSPAHTDPFYNCYAQVVGSKWVWVAPPSCGSAMSSFGATSFNDDKGDEVATHEHLMTNTSQIDVSCSSSYSRYPRFVQEVSPIARQAVLNKGDVLFMPPGWWHSMIGLETSFSVSIWF